MVIEPGQPAFAVGGTLRAAIRNTDEAGPAPVSAEVWLEAHLETLPVSEGMVFTWGRRHVDVVTSDERLRVELALPLHPPSFTGQLFRIVWRIVADVTDARGEERRISREVLLESAPVDRPKAPPAPRKEAVRPALGYREAAREVVPAAPEPLGPIASWADAEELVRRFPQGETGTRLAALVRTRGGLIAHGWKERVTRLAIPGTLFGAGAIGAVILAANWSFGPGLLVIAAAAGVAYLVDRRLQLDASVGGEVARASDLLEVPYAVALGETIRVRVRQPTADVAHLRCIESRAERRISGATPGSPLGWSWETRTLHEIAAPVEGGGGIRDVHFHVPRDAPPTIRHEARHGVSWSIQIGDASAPLMVLPLKVAAAAGALLLAITTSGCAGETARSTLELRIDVPPSELVTAPESGPILLQWALVRVVPEGELPRSDLGTSPPVARELLQTDRTTAVARVESADPEIDVELMVHFCPGREGCPDDAPAAYFALQHPFDDGAARTADLRVGAIPDPATRPDLDCDPACDDFVCTDTERTCDVIFVPR